jgi:hypothetical protein
MAKHLLQGLIKFSTREPWDERFEQILEDHLLLACDETRLEINDIVATIGKDLFMSTAWACAFEDFLTHEFDGGENAIDDYLKRRGWKESASVRSYMTALRNSTMSLYEVSDVVPGTSFRARDLIRGGEPVLISERSATHSLKPWDRIAARVVSAGSRTQICGGVLVYDHGTSEDLLDAWHAFKKLGKSEKRELAKKTLGEDFDEEVIADLSSTEMLRASSSMFTTFWLIDAIDRVRDPALPNLRNSEGDELVLCEVRYPLAAGTTVSDIQDKLQVHDEFCMADTTTWNWVTREKPTASGSGEQPEQSLSFETWHEDGALVLGNVVLEDKAVVLSVNSRQRAERGRGLLSEILGRRIGNPSVKTETVEQIMASRDTVEPQELDISEEEHCAIVHDQMSRHYRGMLDEPVPMLGGETPRAAVKTDSGRIKVAEWLKMMENRTAESGDHNSAMASYNFSWLWIELGISELRQ